MKDALTLNPFDESPQIPCPSPLIVLDLLRKCRQVIVELCQPLHTSQTNVFGLSISPACHRHDVQTWHTTYVSIETGGDPTNNTELLHGSWARGYIESKPEEWVDGLDLLCPIVVYIDETHVTGNGRVKVTPVLMSCGLLNKNVRYLQESCWHIYLIMIQIRQH